MIGFGKLSEKTQCSMAVYCTCMVNFSTKNNKTYVVKYAVLNQQQKENEKLRRGSKISIGG
jgi:hypothetical protein